MNQIHPLKKYRIENRLTQAKVAEMLDTSIATVCRIERGTQGLTIAMTFRLMRKFGFGFYDLHPTLKEIV